MPQKKFPQDLRANKLYGDEAVVISDEKEKQDIVQSYVSFHARSEQWFQQNYEQNFIRYWANFRSKPGEVYMPWDNANNYYMPVTFTNIETYVSRQMATIRGGKNFVTVMPRGRADTDRASVVQQYLKYMLETPMKGYSKLNNNFRLKNIYGTNISMMPWVIEEKEVIVPGKFMFDTTEGVDDWVREAPGGFEGLPEDAPPKDFEGIDLKFILKNNPNYQLRDLKTIARVKDQPDLQNLNIFNVKVDPDGGPDIQKHEKTIVETIETLDTIRTKAASGEYDQAVVDKLVAEVQQGSKDVNKDGQKNTPAFKPESDNSGIQNLNAIDEIQSGPGVQNGHRVWTCFGRHILKNGGFEQETIGVIIDRKFLVRFRPTRYIINGKTYRPLLVDRFIEIPHLFYGIGQGEVLEQLNYLLNHLVNQILNHGDINNSPPLIYPLEGQWDPAEHIYGPGQSWASDNSDGFKILPTPDIKASQVTMITFIEGFMQKVFGISDFTLGGGSGSIVSNQTAHGLANVLRETNRRIDFYAQNSHETYMHDMIEMILWESQAFLDKVEIPRITDKDDPGFEFDDIFNADIQGLYDYKIFADSLTASQEFEQQKWVTLMDLNARATDPATQKMPKDQNKLLNRTFVAFGEDFPEKFDNEELQEGQGQGDATTAPPEGTPPSNPDAISPIEPQGGL